MDNGTKRSAMRNLPRARVTLPMVALLGAGLAMGPMLSGSDRLDEATVLGLADERGMAPVDAKPGLGTEIFQWDAELRDLPPFFVGAVTLRDRVSDGRHYVVVKRAHARALLLLIKPHELRYWVRKP